ncbi:outer membrane family protein [Helicobacter typhlonius]|uniref:outer membrane family protein n=1 Tax=Helicobacter typhlonius TaxID=76936 RepID=UPI002FE1B3D5
MKKTLVVAALGGLFVSSVNAFDYKVSGSAESFTKWGFNNQKLDIPNNQAPTESFTTLFAQLNLNADLGAGFKAGFGGALGGLAFDSTRNDPILDGVGSPVITSYFGTAWDKAKVQNYMVQNAFLEYSYSDNVYFKAGRYQSGKVGEWFSGYNQGAEGYLQAGSVKLWGFLSNRRAFAYDQWFNDFYRVHGIYGGGATRNTYALGLNLTFGGLTLSGFSYYTPGIVTAPGASITFDTNPNKESQGFRSITKIRFLAPIADISQRINAKRWGEIDKHSYTLYLEQRFEVNLFNFGAGYYQNFGNANELIGRWGNPISIDIWTGSAYDIGQSLNDIIGRNAITGFGYIGANYGSFDWKILGRGTNSPRSAEQSVAFILNYQIREDIAVGGKLEWFSDTTKKGYSPLGGSYQSQNNGGTMLTQNRKDDRSHAFFYIRHTF